MKYLFTLISIVLLVTAASAQSVTLTFTGRDVNNQNVPLERVVIRNITKGWQETLTWPDDTALLMSATGLEDVETLCSSSLQVSQNNPNPFDGVTSVNLHVSEPSEVAVVITDITGRVVVAKNYTPQQPGTHTIRITLSSSGVYFLTARQNGRVTSVKMVNRGNGSSDALTLSDAVETPQPQLKAYRSGTDNPFDFGDLMEYVGFATINGEEVESEHLTQEQQGAEMIFLLFGLSLTDGLPCPNTPTVTDIDGNVYNTVMIGTQCWMKENLRITKRSDGVDIPTVSYSTNNSIPYYFDNSSSDIPLEERGLLYSWPAAKMVCPTGWHLPSDAEWTDLTDYMKSQMDFICGDDTNFIAKALASTSWWNSSEGDCKPGDQSVYANNISGFNGVPAGDFFIAEFEPAGFSATFWTSTEDITTGSTFFRVLRNYSESLLRMEAEQYHGHSVRCISDASSAPPSVNTGTVSDVMANTAMFSGNVTANGGSNVTERGVCWSVSANPTVADNHVASGDGLGIFTINVDTLISNTLYHVRAYAINSAGVGYGDEVTFTTLVSGPYVDTMPCPGTPTVTDVDGNTYNTVLIGGQCWTRENLRTTRYADGTDIPLWNNVDSHTDPYYVVGENPVAYGYYYNWPAAMRSASSSDTIPSMVQGVCPTGWHLPSVSEWIQFKNYVRLQSQYLCGGDNSNIAKALAATSGWDYYPYECTVGHDQMSNNASGFCAVPAGIGHETSSSFAGTNAFFWSSTAADNSSEIIPGENINSYSKVFVLRYDSEYADWGFCYKSMCSSVRCLRD